jgi:SOS-response transcriptional repressor LexA
MIMFNKPLTRCIPIIDAQTFGGAGIPDDWKNWKIKSFREIRAISKATLKDKFIGIIVTGDSLKNLGIFHGDLLITKLTTEYDAKKIGVWQTPHGRTAKFAYEDFDGTVVLHNQNGWQQKWQADEIKLVGVVVRVERDMD